MTSGALQLCSEIIFNILIMPKIFAHVTVECIGVVDPPVDVYVAVYARERRRNALDASGSSCANCHRLRRGLAVIGV